MHGVAGVGRRALERRCWAACSLQASSATPRERAVHRHFKLQASSAVHRLGARPLDPEASLLFARVDPDECRAVEAAPGVRAPSKWTRCISPCACAHTHARAPSKWTRCISPCACAHTHARAPSKWTESPPATLSSSAPGSVGPSQAPCCDGPHLRCCDGRAFESFPGRR